MLKFLDVRDKHRIFFDELIHPVNRCAIVVLHVEQRVVFIFCSDDQTPLRRLLCTASHSELPRHHQTPPGHYRRNCWPMGTFLSDDLSSQRKPFHLSAGLIEPSSDPYSRGNPLQHLRREPGPGPVRRAGGRPGPWRHGRGGIGCGVRQGGLHAAAASRGRPVNNAVIAHGLQANRPTRPCPTPRAGVPAQHGGHAGPTRWFAQRVDRLPDFPARSSI